VTAFLRLFGFSQRWYDVFDELGADFHHAAAAAAVVNPTFARTILRGSDAVGTPMHWGAPCGLK
jgi:hypothetical protein